MNMTLKRLALAIAGAGMLTIYGCGGGEDETTSSIGDVALKSGGSAGCAAQFTDNMGYALRLKDYQNDGQCSPQIQAAESHRQAAIANCSAGDATSAATNYKNYNTSLNIVDKMCP